MEAAIRRLVLILAAAAAGFVVGCAAGLVSIRYQPANEQSFAEFIHLPHHVPGHRGGAAFRFAMAHDVIHERFPKHGPTYYLERNRLTRAKLAKLTDDNPASFPLADDLGAGLHRLGRSDEAITVLRSKLARQQAMNYAGRVLYTSYANLGTILVHRDYDKAAAGDTDARERFREGVGLIRRSVELNPGAHFGREKWQAAIPEFLLVAMDKPDLLKTFDCIGNRLDLEAAAILNHRNSGQESSYGRAADAEFVRGWLPEQIRLTFNDAETPIDEPARWPEVSPVRKHITKVGAENGWAVLPIPSHQEPVPFDEPILGIIDMWRQGGGANPHFALAIGETMLRVGQRYIAWTAYARAARMADQFCPDPTMKQFLRDHCRKRQEQIEATLLAASSLAEKDTSASLRSRFNDELAFGERYQKAYQRYEAEKIAAGVAITDEHFFDEFHAGHEPIASPSGPEEWLVRVKESKEFAYNANRVLSWGIFGAGLSAMATVLLMRWRARRAVARMKRVIDNIGG